MHIFSTYNLYILVFDKYSNQKQQTVFFLHRWSKIGTCVYTVRLEHSLLSRCCVTQAPDSHWTIAIRAHQF